LYFLFESSVHGVVARITTLETETQSSDQARPPDTSVWDPAAGGVLLGHVFAQVDNLFVLLVAMVALVRRIRRVSCEVDVEDAARDERFVTDGTGERCWN